MRRILVTGRGGQLATGLATALPAQGFEAILVGQPDFEFDQPATIAAAFAAARPDAVVNCAAWTAVDAAEDAEAAAFTANAIGPALVARHCAALGIPLIQISTDYVFDGRKGAPYVETDTPNPLSAYGRTKLAGEWAALATNPQTTVLRTAWVFSAVGTNFLRTMLRVGAQRDELRVVADQHGSPTAAPDLADAIASVLARIRDTGWQRRPTAASSTPSRRAPPPGTASRRRSSRPPNPTADHSPPSSPSPPPTTQHAPHDPPTHASIPHTSHTPSAWPCHTGHTGCSAWSGSTSRRDLIAATPGRVEIHADREF